MGVEVAKKEKKVCYSAFLILVDSHYLLSRSPQLGIRASSTHTLNFDEIKVPAENLIGTFGHGYKSVSSPCPAYALRSDY